MEYLDIRFALLKKGYALAQVARELDLAGPQSVRDVLRRKYWSARVERKVSEITGISLHQLFPDRYQKGNKPRKGGPLQPTAQ